MVATELRHLSSEGEVSIAPVVVSEVSLPMPEFGPASVFGRVLKLAAAAAMVLMVSCGALLVHAGRGTPALESAVPSVAPSLQVALEDVHQAVAGFDDVPGMSGQLDRVDRTLVARRYAAAAGHIRELVVALAAASEAGLVEQPQADDAVTAAWRLFGLLPGTPSPASTAASPSPPSTVASPGPAAGAVPSTKQQSGGSAHKPSHGGKKPKHAHGKKHRR
jgi:hypothetical protein